MKKVKYLVSATKPKEYPPPNMPEIALAGRSNAGKSSFMNAMTGRKEAFVSSKPGKTRILNFFDIDDRYRIVDMPGYGYSSRSGEEQMSWRDMIESFLAERPNLVGVMLFIDSRRDWEADEEQLFGWLERLGRPVVIIFTKVDKLNRSEETQLAKKLKGLFTGKYFLTSAQDETGIEEVEEFVFREWIKPNL